MSTNPQKIGLNNPFLSLKHENYRYYFFGMCVSTIGTWMQNTAQPWLAYSLTKSALLLSVVSALQFLPALLFSLFAGVLIDRLPKKRMLIVTQSLSLVITFVLWLLVHSGGIQYWHLLVTASLLGLVNTLDMPLRHSFVVEMVGHDDLMNAIALNSLTFNVARMIGPSIAGIIMGAFGVSACFLVNSLSFLAVLISLFFIHPIACEVVKEKEEQQGVFVCIREGLTYIFHNETLFTTMLFMTVVSIFALNYGVTIPVFATQVLGLAETGYGFLMSTLGAGALMGALFVAALSKSGPMRFILTFLPALTGLILILIGNTNSFLTTSLTLAVGGFLFVTYLSTANSNLQIHTVDRFRGRVMSVYSLIVAGSTPIGNLFVGAMDNWFGARMGFIASGIAVMIFIVPIFVYM
ncbi:MAG: MFS transporter, partial [Eubacteriales bacterium]|nr:MFS transporter [Eubacteriales bacterium]